MTPDTLTISPPASPFTVADIPSHAHAHTRAMAGENPTVPPPAAVSDRAELAIETARQQGGTLDPDSMVVPRGERLTTFLNTEPDQGRIDSYAYEWLQTGTEAQAKGQGGGIHEEFRAGLRQYADFRKARGEEPFQYLNRAKGRAEERAAREQVPFFQKLFTAPEKMAEAFPEDQRAAFEERFTDSLNPTGEKHKTAGVMLVATMTGKPADQVADLWPQYREAYGRDVLKISGKLDDSVFYAAAGQAFEKEAKDDETARSIAQQAQRAAIQGRPLSYAIEQGKAATGDEWKRFSPAARTAYAGILADFSDGEIKAGRALFEAVADQAGKPVEDIAQGDGKKAAWVIALESYGAADQATRDRIMGLIALQAEGEDIQNYFKRLGAAAASGLDMLTTGTGTLSARGNVTMFEEIAAKETDPAEKARMQTEINRMKGTATFAQDLQTAGVKVRRYLDDKREGFWDTAGDWGVMAAESLPVMAAAGLPFGAGLPAVITSYGERNLSELRREQPDADPDTLAAIAYTAAPIEAGIDRLQFLTLGARLPKLNARLLKYGKPGAVAVAVARTGAVTGLETVQEVGQDLTRPLIQELAGVLTEEIKGPNWSVILSKEADALGDIAGVSLIFGIVGGTGSTIADYVRAPRLAEALQDRDGLALAGYSAETIEEVATLAAENPAAAAETLKAAQIETPKEERQANSQAARERIEAEAAEATGNQDAGIPTLEKQPDGKIQVNFPNAPAVLYDDQEQALEAVREWEQADEVDTTRAVREYMDFLTDYHASNPEATFTGRQTTADPTLETWAGDNKQRIAKANARVDILLRQAGTDMGLERPLLSEIPILGTSRNIRAGAITRLVSEINRTGTPLTVIEEAAESVGKWLMADGKVSETKLIGWIRSTEQQTKTKILADEIATMPEVERAQEIAEAFSFIAKNNAIGKIQDSALPSQVKAFFRAFKEVIASALRIAADFARLRAEGKVDSEFGYWLDVAAGLEPEFQMDNLTRQMEAEMLAESMDGFTEIQDALKGRIPHPDTLKAAGDPLAGEVARLLEGMMNNPENGANKAARTRKVNEFFLPKGTTGNLDELRRSLNEQGFDFQTPAEMIEAADLSINYGRKQYGTTEAAPDSMEDLDEWEPTFSVALRRVAPVDYPATARELIGITNVHSLTHALLEPGGELVPLDESKPSPMMVSPAYKAAKRGGDQQAAWDIAGKFITAPKIKALVAALAGKQPVFVPITQAESARVNLLPLAAAYRLQSLIGGRVEESIHIPKKGTGNTGADTVSRMAKADEFTGSVTTGEGEAVILVDDTFTTGNTLTGLFDYIAGQGVTPQAVFAIASGRYSKAIAPTPAKMQAALDKAGVSAEQFARAIGFPIERFTGAELHAYTLNGQSGLAGFRRRFGLESGQGSAPMVSRQDRGGEDAADQVSAQQGETFSITLRTDPLLAAIEAQIKSPEKKAEVYQKMKARVSAVKRRFEDRRLRGEFDNAAGDIDRARFEQIRDIAILEAIGKAMPPDIRGKIVGSFRKVADLKTTKARAKYITALLPRIENALESSLKRHYRAAIRRQMKQAAFKVAESRTRGGKIGALGHAVFEEAKAAMKLTDDSASKIGGKAAAQKAEELAESLRETLEGTPDLTDEQIAELDGRISAVELFGDYGNADSARLEQALGFLNGTYTEGRREWLDVLTARRDLRAARVAIVEAAMGREGPATDAERNAATQRAQGILTRIDEAVMQAGLSGSQKLRRLAELSEDPEIKALTEDMEIAFLEAENQESDAGDADSRALAAAMRRIFNVSTEYGVAKKLRELTTATGAAPVEKIEGRKVETVKVPIKYIEAILAGELDQLEAGGEKFAEEVKAFDDHDLAQLEQVWEAFNDLPKDEQGKKRNLSFERIAAAGARMTIGEVNQLQGLQLYLTMKQPDQAAKLARLGYDETTLAQLEAWLKPETLALGAWMVGHIGAEAFTLDSIHRAEKGVGLKLVENYFPVRNDVAGADNTGLSINGGAIQHTGKSIGAIKERVSNNAPPAYVNAVAVFLANRAQVNFWKAHVATLREWGGVIRDERFASAVKIRMGETYYQSLNTLLKRIESGGALNAAKLMDFEILIKGLTSSFAVGTLGGRVSTLAVNVAAGLNAGLEIPAADLAAGIAEVFARPEAFKDAFNSPAIQRRLTQGASYEAQLAKSSGPARNPTLATLNSWAQRGVMPINYVDTGANVIGAAVVWEHTRKESIRAGMTEEQARAAADRKVSILLLRSAQPTTRLAKSEMELKAAENPLAALFTLFTSEPRKTLAILYMASRELATGKGTYGKPMAAQQLFVAAVIFQTADFMIRQASAAFAKADDDEPDSFLERLRKRVFDAKAWGYALTTTHLRAVPIGGEVWSHAWAKAFDQKAFTGSQNPLNRASREVLTFKKPETTEEAIDGAIDILQGVGPVIPGGAVFAQGGNLAEFVSGVATSNGVSFSDEDRAARIKSRFTKFKAELETIHGKTQQPTGKPAKGGKPPATKADPKIQAAKWAAMADRLRADLAPASPEIRALVIESIQAPEEVKKRVAKELKTATTPTP